MVTTTTFVTAQCTDLHRPDARPQASDEPAQAQMVEVRVGGRRRAEGQQVHLLLVRAQRLVG